MPVGHRSFCGMESNMRKPRDIDAELRALRDRAKVLKARKVQQLGELVAITGADTLDLETLAGMLRSAVRAAKSTATREAWRSDGAAFFQGRRRRKKDDGASGTAHGHRSGPASDESGNGPG